MPESARRTLADADLLFSAEQIDQALVRLATEITKRVDQSFPLVLTVMNGGMVFAGQLLPRLAFPLECDYLHATRYGGTIAGSELNWIAEPRISCEGRTVLLLDDILDEGITLAAIKSRLLASGAKECLVAVLAEKASGKIRPISADFVGVVLPNRYVFGCGMDIGGVWRNLPAIYAAKGM